MVRGGWSRRSSENPDEAEYAFRYTNNDIQRILKTTPLRDFVDEQYLKYIAHVARMENTAIPKKMFFATPQRSYYRDPWIKISELMGMSSDQAKRITQSRKEFDGLMRQRFNPTSR